ncbi:MAG: hypothetical protein LC731_01435, partial [Acidobacteria bacterium]|nr:hypothetical protein [Acidobacteriota bacterium]
MIRQAIRLNLVTALVAFCLYLPCADKALAQQENQSKPAASNASAASPKTTGQTTNATSQPLDIRGKASENLIDGSLKDDPEVQKMIAPYKTRVDELNTPIG